MSLQFSTTASPYDGLIQRIETNIYVDDVLGRISGNATLLGLWTTRLNLAMDRAYELIFEADGRYQFDDSNHTKHPIMFFDLVQGQTDYTFTADQQSNLILDIQKVAILNSATETLYNEVAPRDVQTSGQMDNLLAGNTEQGVPTAYDKTGNGFFFDKPPSYNATNGVKVYFSREGSYFTTSDTTKMPGFLGTHHTFLADHATFDYSKYNDISNVNITFSEIRRQEKALKKSYARRAEDERSVMTPKRISFI